MEKTIIFIKNKNEFNFLNKYFTRVGKAIIDDDYDYIMSGYNMPINMYVNDCVILDYISGEISLSRSFTFFEVSYKSKRVQAVTLKEYLDNVSRGENI